MMHVPHFNFPLIPTSFASDYKHPLQVWDHCKWVRTWFGLGFCLLFNSVCGLYLSKNKKKEHTSNGGCCWYRFVSCNHPESNHLIHWRGSADRLSNKNHPEIGRKLVIFDGLKTHLQSGAFLLLVPQWDSFETSGPISDEGLFIPQVLIHSTKQFAENLKTCTILIEKPQKVLTKGLLTIQGNGWWMNSSNIMEGAMYNFLHFQVCGSKKCVLFSWCISSGREVTWYHVAACWYPAFSSLCLQRQTGAGCLLVHFVHDLCMWNPALVQKFRLIFNDTAESGTKCNILLA